LNSFDSFKKLKMQEIYNFALTKNKSLPLVVEFNKMASWVTQSILSKEKIKERVKVLEYLMTLLSNLFEIGDFNNSMAIFSGISNVSVHRLMFTWEMVNSSIKKKFDSISEQMSSTHTFMALRNIVNTKLPPLIPYIGIYLTDFVFIEDGNESFTGNNCVNWKKFVLKCNIVQKLGSYQCVGFGFKTLPEIQKFIVEIFQETDGQNNDEKYFKKSLELEPRRSNRNDIQ
jgi:hypothetical protein